MKAAPFRYVAPSSVSEALTVLSEHADAAKVLAGGQSLMPMLAFRFAQPEVLVDLNRVDALDYVRRNGEGVSIGAMTRNRVAETAPEVISVSPLLAEAMPFVGHRQIRNRGTVGGSLAHADPVAELPIVVTTQQAELVLESERGKREVGAAHFFRTFLTTALEPDELLIEVRLPPAAPHTGHSFLEVSRRRGDFALVSVGASVGVAEDEVCTHLRAVLGGVSDVPFDVSPLLAPAVGSPLTDAVVSELGASVRGEVEPSGDVHASAGYRKHVAGVLTERAIRTAWWRARARGGR